MLEFKLIETESTYHEKTVDITYKRVHKMNDLQVRVKITVIRFKNFKIGFQSNDGATFELNAPTRM